MAKKAVKKEKVEVVVETVDSLDADLASGKAGLIPKDGEDVCQDQILVEE